MKTILRNFVVFEGGDGSGTTTQLNLLRARFQEAGGQGLSLPPFHGDCEPTDSPVGRLLREGLRGGFQMSPLTAALLFAADRSGHIFGPGGVEERCLRGEIVVSDRYILSSIVYQGISLGDSAPIGINRFFPLPELLFFFDIDPEAAQRRMAGRAVREIYEDLAFQQVVGERYRAALPRFAAWGTRTVTIDAALPPAAISEKVWAEMQNLPILQGKRQHKSDKQVPIPPSPPTAPAPAQPAAPEP